MIQTKKNQTQFDMQGAPLYGKIVVSIAQFTTNESGKTYKVVDNLVTENGVSHWLSSREKNITAEEYNSIDAFLEQTLDFTAMDNAQKEWFKITNIYLYLLTNHDLVNNKTRWNVLADQWELTPISNE